MFYKHNLSDVLSETIGKNTSIWQFVVILKNAKIGENCNICSHVFIENDVTIGNNVTIKNGVQIWDGIQIEDNVFIGPNVTFCNVKYPESKVYPDKWLTTKIGNGASIGANSTILPGLKIGKGVMIGAGSVVTKDIPSYAIVYGNPARICGYCDTEVGKSNRNENNYFHAERKYTDIGSSQILSLPFFSDIRGNLSVAEFQEHIPFLIKRLFWIYDVPSQEIRGEHAHKKLQQFLICVKGSVSVVIDDGFNRREILLDKPNIGLFIPSKIWGIQYKYSKDALLLVLASDKYDNDDYIRNYDQFLTYIKEQNSND